MSKSVRGLAGGLLVAMALAAGAAAPVRAEGTPATRRLAVVVGANAAAPGRKPLRFGHTDARAVARVLRDLGGFSRDDVHVLLDPDPAAVLGALDAALRTAERGASDTLVLFYYSGHADTAALYPGGRPLALESLRERLEDGRAAMRIGIIDACRGGGWTGSKGLSASETFAIEQALDLTSQGSALIASSSGLEDAHESVALRGSFFTHHWNAGLRGAGDRNGDDRVTLSEAFEYARALTIRDTALHTESPQHPSYRFNLRGRGDPLLAELSPGSSVIELRQDVGPLQIIHLGTGLLVVELPKGARRARVSLAPGHYLVRRRTSVAVMAREVRLGVGRRVQVTEASLIPILVSGNRSASKGRADVAITSVEAPDLRPDLPSEWMLSFLLGRADYNEVDFLTGGYSATDDYWGIEGAYLLRHGRYLTTRMGLGYTHTDTLSSGAVSATVGEMLSWPLLAQRNHVLGTSSYAVEPFVAAHVTERVGLEADAWDEIPLQTQLGVSAGVRLLVFHTQIGYTFLEPGVGPRVEVGVRFAADLF
jgi:Caspase domain